MKKFIQFNNEDGVSLPELLAAIVILGILFTILMSVFVNSTRVNIKSEELIDVTYVAQTELENLYALSTGTKFGDRITAIETIGYTNDSSHPIVNELKFTKLLPDKAEIDLILKPVTEPAAIPTDPDVILENMSSAGISVKAITGGTNPIENQEAQMELVLTWEADTP